MNNSKKPVKNIDNLLGKKTFFFPNELANERYGNDMQPCILIRANGKPHYIFTGKSVEIDRQEYAILKDAGIITNDAMYAENKEFDPLRKEYEI